MVGQSDRPGLQVSLPVLGVVVGPWKEVKGHLHPVHLEPHSSQESGSLLLQPLTLCELFHRWSVSKPIACMLGGGKAPRLSEVHCDRDSVCVKTDT